MEVCTLSGNPTLSVRALCPPFLNISHAHREFPAAFPAANGHIVLVPVRQLQQAPAAATGGREAGLLGALFERRED